MQQVHYVKNANGDTLLNVANATFETGDLPLGFETGTFIIAFYDAGGNLVTPTAGTAKPEMSPIDGQWLAPGSGDATITATTVIAGSATYKMPVFNGPAIKGRVTLAGVTGAVKFKAYFWRG